MIKNTNSPRYLANVLQRGAGPAHKPVNSAASSPETPEESNHAAEYPSTMPGTHPDGDSVDAPSTWADDSRLVVNAKSETIPASPALAPLPVTIAGPSAFVDAENFPYSLVAPIPDARSPKAEIEEVADRLPTMSSISRAEPSLRLIPDQPGNAGLAGDRFLPQEVEDTSGVMTWLESRSISLLDPEMDAPSLPLQRLTSTPRVSHEVVAAIEAMPTRGLPLHKRPAQEITAMTHVAETGADMIVRPANNHGRQLPASLPIVEFERLPSLGQSGSNSQPAARQEESKDASPFVAVPVKIPAGQHAFQSSHSRSTLVIEETGKRLADRSASLNVIPAPRPVIDPGMETAFGGRNRTQPRNDAPRLTINRLDIQLVNNTPAAPVQFLQPPAPVTHSADVWDELDRHHLGTAGVML